MNFFELTKIRESCRAYDAEKSVAGSDIEKIIDAARNCPSACNSQPWKFVVATGQTAEKMPGTITMPLLPINKFVKGVPAFIVICETKARLFRGAPVSSQHYAQMDIGIATATLCYAATELGLSTCILGSFNEQKVRELLEIPKSIKIRLVVTLGYAKDEGVRAKKRKETGEILSYNKW